MFKRILLPVIVGSFLAVMIAAQNLPNSITSISTINGGSVVKGTNVFLTTNADGTIKIDVPASGNATNLTPWTSDIDGAGFALTNANVPKLQTVGFPRSTNGLVVTITNGYVTPFSYGALGGVADDTVAFSNALNSGFAVLVPSWTNYTVANLYLSNGMTMFGDGSKITFKTGSTGYMIDTATATNFHLRHLYLDGGNPPDTNVLYWQPSQGTRTGIRTFVFAANSSIEDVTCNNFTDTGFRFGNNGIGTPTQIGPVTTSQSMRQSSLRFYANESRGNYIGYDLAGYDANNVQEYININNCTARNCYYGLSIADGNIYINGGTYTGNNYGVYVFNGGPNNAHGIVSAASLNHNNVSVYCDSITTGFTFDACKLIGGGNYIWLHNAKGVTFQNCQLDLDYGINDGGGTNYCKNNFWTSNDPATVWTNANSGIMMFNGNEQVLGNTQSAVSHFTSKSNNFFGIISAGGNSSITATDGGFTYTNRLLTVSNLTINGAKTSTTVVNLGLDANNNVVTNVTPIGGGSGSQTPWAQDIQGAGFSALNVRAVVLGTSGNLGSTNGTIAITNAGIVMTPNSSAGITMGSIATTTASQPVLQMNGRTNRWGKIRSNILDETDSGISVQGTNANSSSVDQNIFTMGGKRITGEIPAAWTNTANIHTNILELLGTNGSFAKFDESCGLSISNAGAGASLSTTNALFTVASTNSVGLANTNGAGYTFLYANSGTLYTHGSGGERTMVCAPTTAIDGKTTGQTTIYTVDSGRSFLIDKIIIVPTTITTLTTPSTVSIGKTGASYIDVVGSTALTGLITVNTAIILSPITGYTYLGSGDTLKINVSVGAVGTAYTFSVFVIGWPI